MDNYASLTAAELSTLIYRAGRELGDRADRRGRADRDSRIALRVSALELRQLVTTLELAELDAELSRRADDAARAERDADLARSSVV